MDITIIDSDNILLNINTYEIGLGLSFGKIQFTGQCFIHLNLLVVNFMVWFGKYN